MDRQLLLGVGAIGVVLAAGAYLWSRQTGPIPDRADRPVRVVRGEDPQSIDAASVPGQVPNDRTPGTPATPRVEANTVGTIPEDAELQASLPDPSLAPNALYKRIRAEPRDAEWAGRSERSIRAALAVVPYVGQDGLRVSCASTLCEVRGAMRTGISDENANVAMQSLQGDKLRNSLEGGGLEVAMATFGGHPGTWNFTIYARRR